MRTRRTPRRCARRDWATSRPTTGTRGRWSRRGCPPGLPAGASRTKPAAASTIARPGDRVAARHRPVRRGAPRSGDRRLEPVHRATAAVPTVRGSSTANAIRTGARAPSAARRCRAGNPTGRFRSARAAPGKPRTLSRGARGCHTAAPARPPNTPRTQPSGQPSRSSGAPGARRRRCRASRAGRRCPRRVPAFRPGSSSECAAPRRFGRQASPAPSPGYRRRAARRRPARDCTARRDRSRNAVCRRLAPAAPLGAPRS